MTALSRRSFVALGTSAVFASTFGARMAFARAATDRRFVFIIQRGAADGLHIGRAGRRSGLCQPARPARRRLRLGAEAGTRCSRSIRRCGTSTASTVRKQALFTACASPPLS